MFSSRTGLALLFLLLAAAEVQAQGWTASVSAGTTTHESVAADVGSGSAIFGVRRDGDLWLFLNGGLPWDSDGVPWGAAGVGGRASTPLGPLDAGVDAMAQGHLYSIRGLDARGSGLTGTLLPHLALASSSVGAEIYTGPLFYRQALDGPDLQGSSLRTLHDTGARLWFAPDPRWVASADLRYLREDAQGYRWAGGSLAFVEGPVGGWATAGYWDLDASQSLSWSVGGSLEVGWSSRVTASFSSDAPDPIYWNSPRRSWTVGIERRLTAPPAPLPVAVVAERRDQQIQISIPGNGNETAPSIAGDFTHWERVPMTREGAHWVAHFALEPGVYHYAFVDAQGDWFVPDSLPAVDDGMGGESAILVVQ